MSELINSHVAFVAFTFVGKKRAVIVEIRQGVFVAAGKSQAKLIMPIHYISNAQKTVRLCKYSSAEKSSHSSEVWNASS